MPSGSASGRIRDEGGSSQAAAMADDRIYSPGQAMTGSCRG